MLANRTWFVIKNAQFTQHTLSVEETANGDCQIIFPFGPLFLASRSFLTTVPVLYVIAYGDSISLGTLMPRKVIPATLGNAGPVIGSKRQLLAETKSCSFFLYIC